MLKQVVVLGDGRGENVIGDMIESELPVEVIRIGSAMQERKLRRSESEIREWAEMALGPYLGKVDLVVLANSEITLAAEEHLRRICPEQEIVGYGEKLLDVFNRDHAIWVLASDLVRRMTKYQEMKIEYQSGKVEERHLKNFSQVEIERNLKDCRGGLVVLYSTELIPVKKKIQEEVKWRAKVIDMRESLFREACMALGFRGADGKRPRELEG